MRIWKYALCLTDRQVLAMPRGAQLLTVQVQRDRPCLWALVDQTDECTETRQLAIYGTGNLMPNSPGMYIGTFQIDNGSLVFHVFEIPRLPVRATAQQQGE